MKAKIGNMGWRDYEVVADFNETHILARYPNLYNTQGTRRIVHLSGSRGAAYQLYRRTDGTYWATTGRNVVEAEIQE